LLEEEVKGESISKAEGKLRESWFEKIPINIEGKVSVVIADEGVDESELIDYDNRDRKEEEVGCQGMS
jgi:hypothetical protein